jgi:Protein of unknown function (DUF3363)
MFELLAKPVCRLHRVTDESTAHVPARNKQHGLIARGRLDDAKVAGPFSLRNDRAIRATHATKVERRGIFRMPHLARVRRLDMHEYVAGAYRQRFALAFGRFAMIDDGLGFQLVPWTPSLEKQLGRHVAGLARGDGGVDWDFGRNRGLGL